jgi:hypothetical protein
VNVYFHNDGFCLGSSEQPNFNSGYLWLRAPCHLPEHHLPAAIDDAELARAEERTVQHEHAHGH